MPTGEPTISLAQTGTNTAGNAWSNRLGKNSMTMMPKMRLSRRADPGSSTGGGGGWGEQGDGPDRHRAEEVERDGRGGGPEPVQQRPADGAGQYVRQHLGQRDHTSAGGAARGDQDQPWYGHEGHPAAEQ